MIKRSHPRLKFSDWNFSGFWSLEFEASLSLALFLESGITKAVTRECSFRKS